MVLPLNRSSILFQSSAALSAVAKVFAFSVEELADGVGLKQMRGAELVGHKADVCEVLQRLHLQESVEESVSVGDDAVVRHEDRGVAGDERAETGGNLVGACGGVRSKRNWAEGHDGLRAQRLVEGAEAVMTLGTVPLAPYATTGTDEIAASLRPLIPSHTAILMSNHGVVTYGDTLLDAFLKMETLEHFAHICLVAHQLGTPHLLETHAVGQLLDAKSKYLRNSR